MAWATNFWHKVGLFAIPWGRTFQWYHTMSVWKLGEANRFWSEGCKGMVNKQSFKSRKKGENMKGEQQGKEVQAVKDPWFLCFDLYPLRFYSKLHLPDFFLIAKIVFRGLVQGSICPCCNCSTTSECIACSFSWERGHWSIHMGLSDFQIIGSAVP